MRRALALLLVLALPPAALADASPAPPPSLYALQAPLVAQDGRATTLDRHRGHPTVVSMFYAQCPNVCPTLIARLRHLERGLPAASRARLRVLLVSVDPERDTPEALRAIAARHGVDGARWTFARAAPEDVRKIAAALNLRYRALPGGEFNHATVLTLVDGEGRILAKTSTLAGEAPEFAAALAAATGAPAPGDR